MKAGQGVCEKRHSCPESGMCREEGLISSSMMGGEGRGWEDWERGQQTLRDRRGQT